MHLMGPLQDRLSTGLRWGFMYAAVCSAVGLGSVLIRGPSALRPYHLSVAGMVALYLGCGMVGGSVFGLLMPVGRTLLGAVFLGLLVAIPVAVLMVMAVAPDITPGSGEFVWTCSGVSLLGPVGGAGLWIVNSRR